jgi:hypothetical protein
MNLFLDNPDAVEKTAAVTARLSQNPNDWQTEILNEVYRQNPFIGAFSTRVIINEQDGERRYAIGAIEVVSKMSENTLPANIPPSVSGQKRVLIPIIINEGKLFPLDTFLHKGKAQPLTEDRLHRAMFRPNLFEGVSNRPGDQDMMSILYPPNRNSSIGIGAGNNARIMDAASVKTSSRKILPHIKNSFDSKDVQQFMNDFAGDINLHSKLAQNNAVIEAIKPLASSRYDKVSYPDRVQKVAHAIPPQVLQFSYAGEGKYLVKTANPDALTVEENLISRPEVSDLIGADMVRKVENGGDVTLNTNPVVKDSLIDIEVAPIEQFGEYRVKNNENTEMLGWVFPYVLDLDGTSLAIKIFTNGSQSAIQERISGVFVGKSTDLPDSHPEGFGMFYYAKPSGVVGIVPLHVNGNVLDQGVQAYLCETSMGEAVTIRKVHGLMTIQQIAPQVYGIPDACGFLPLPNVVPLAETADEFMKIAELSLLDRRAEVMFDQGGRTYSFRGAEIQKLASEQPVSMVDELQAKFNLALLGCSAGQTETKLASARAKSAWIPVDGVNPITLFSSFVERGKLASATVAKACPGIKKSMVKEAAVLDDPLTVDHVLSIGFINPENIGTFISFIPDFEETLSKLSELLIASRLGLSIVDTGALERVTRHMDRVIKGLRELAQHPQA